MVNARNLTAEFLGTFGLIFFSSGAIVVDQARNGMLGLVGIALTQVAILSVMVTALIRVSGAHFNPAVTVALWLANKIDLKSAGAYIATQLVAATAAAFLLIALLPQSAIEITAVGVPQIAPDIDLVPAILIETVLTFFLVSAFFGTAVSSKAPAVGGFGIGLVLMFAVLMGGPLTGAALNPARAFGPALAAGHWSGHAAYWIGPILGGLVAALVWSKLLLPKEDQS
jgi:aquaporin TIP